VTELVPGREHATRALQLRSYPWVREGFLCTGNVQFLHTQACIVWLDDGGSEQELAKG
jgi:hypothetical protein